MTASQTPLIRVATADDLDDLARLNRNFNGGEETAARIRQRLDDPQCVEIPLVAMIDGRAVGFAGLRVVPYIFYAGVHAELTELYVEEAFQRRGVGRELMRYAEALAKARGAHELVLHTGADNHAARAFYAAMGYEEWELVLGRGLS